MQELEKDNFDLRNENKNLKRILKSNNFAVANEYNLADDENERTSEIKAFLNKTQQSVDKNKFTSAVSNNALSSQELGN